MELLVVGAEIGAAQQVAKQLQAYLRSTLHRWPEHATHQMADEAFARVEVEGNVVKIVFGSPAPYTFWHEVRYHAQLRQTLDVWAPIFSRMVMRAIAARMNAGSGRP